MEEIDSKENKTSYSYYFYILKDSSDLKGVILRLQTSYRYLTLQIRYGEQEYYYGNNVLYSILLGIVFLYQIFFSKYIGNLQNKEFVLHLYLPTILFIILL
jgi:hypothetical protein